MRLLYMLGFLPPYVSREMEALAKRGHSITAFLPNKSSSPDTADFWEKLNPATSPGAVEIHYCLPYGLLTAGAVKLAGPVLSSVPAIGSMCSSLKNGELKYFLIAANAAKLLLRCPRPNVIHSHFAMDQAHISRILSSITGIPYTVTVHARDIFVPQSRTRLMITLSQAARVFTISEFNRKYLIDLGLPKERITVARLGIDCDDLPERKPAGRTMVVCTASGLVAKKGVHVLLKAAEILVDMGVNVDFRVIGSDPGGSRLEEFRRKAAGLPVSFTGALESSAVLEEVAGASVFILPSVKSPSGDMDGIPVSLMEAMGMGVPSISTSLSGIPELIEHGVSGLLVPPESPSRLAEAIEFLVTREDIAGEMGARGRHQVEKLHSPAALAETLENAFRETAQTKR